MGKTAMKSVHDASTEQLLITVKKKVLEGFMFHNSYQSVCVCVHASFKETHIYENKKWENARGFAN